MFAASRIFTTFVSNSFKQSNEISQELALLSPSAKTSLALALQLSEHSSINFFGSSTLSLLGLSLRSSFLRVKKVSN